MAIQAAVANRRGRKDDISDMRQQLQDEASKLLSLQTLGTRMAQLDSIIKRRAEKVFFSMETETTSKAENMAQASQKKEKLVHELLKKVKKRLKMVRSYTYLSWFCIFFFSFLGNLFLKEDNMHLYAVDNSIQNRIVNILPSGSSHIIITMSGFMFDTGYSGTVPDNAAFYDWFSTVLSDVFQENICGDGICEGEEYPGFGRFGCVADCGRYLQKTPIRIEMRTAWMSKPDGLDLPAFAMGAGYNLNLQFTYNIFSETMNDYIFSEDSNQSSMIVEVPDGNLWLELYQSTTTYLETTPQDISTYARVGPGTINGPNKSFDFQYGDAAEAITAVAQINRQLRDYCTIDNDGSKQYSSCPKAYDANRMASILRGMYGLKGNISVYNGQSLVNVLSFPFCSLNGDMGSPDFAVVDPVLCSIGSDAGSIPTNIQKSCYDGNSLAKRFRCTGRYPFSVWSFGSARKVDVKPGYVPKLKKLTPFNNVIGSIVMTQYRRKEVSCATSGGDGIGILTGQFPCQGTDVGDSAFGIDPVFQRSSKLYNGKLKIKDYYSESEVRRVNATNGENSLPFAFFPHQLQVGGRKSRELISNSNVGLYKLFFDTRFSPSQSKKLVQFMRDGMFLSDKTSMLELEIVTYNAEFNLFGIFTIQFNWDQGGGILWEYQYNTAQLSPYSGIKGQLTLSLEILFGFMLIVDIIRESRDIYHAVLREDVLQGYVMKFWNWIDWSHYSLLGCSLGVWIAYNSYISSLGLKGSYSVASNLSPSCRMFATDAKEELDFIEFMDKMRNLSELKNFYTAINCLNITFFVIRILKILDFQPRMSLITRTLRVASVDLGHYLCLFCIILVGYGSVGTLLLGDRLEDFQTFGKSCSELFMIFMGWDPLYRVMGKAASQTKVQATIVAFQLFYWSWVLVASFLMLNMALAIIVDAYATVKAEMSDAPTIVHEAYTVGRETVQLIANRFCGKQWFIKDAHLEKILMKQNRNFQSQKKLLDRVSQIRGKSKSVRLAGGLEVNEQDLEAILQSSGATGKNLLAKANSFMPADTLRQNKAEDGVEIEESAEWRASPAVENLIKRYGEVVPEGKDDEDLLDLIRTENMKRQLAMYTSQDQIRQKVDTAIHMLSVLARVVLPEGEYEKLQTAMLVKRNADGCISLDVGDIISGNSKVKGTLKVTIVSAKHLPRLDIFSESDPYCVLVVEKPSEEDDDGVEIVQEPIGRTETRKNDRNPIWNSEFSASLECTSATKLTAVILDKDEHGEDDLIGLVAIIISNLPLGQEVDKWYKLHNDVSPNLAKRAMVRLKIRFTADVDSGTINASGLLDIRADSKKSLVRADSGKSHKSGHGIDLKDELQWLNEKLTIAGDVPEKIGARILELTLISARHLPRRDAFFMKVDPYVKIAFNGAEHESLIRKRTYSPDWGQSFTFHVKEVSDVSDSLRLAVMDWDRLSKHDVIGFLEISHNTMIELLSKETDWYHEQTFHIQRKGRFVIGNDGNRSQVTLGFRVKDPAAESDLAALRDDALRAAQALEDVLNRQVPSIERDDTVSSPNVHRFHRAVSDSLLSICESQQKSRTRSFGPAQESDYEEMFDAVEMLNEDIDGIPVTSATLDLEIMLADR